VKGWIIGLAVGAVAAAGLVVAGLMEGSASAGPQPTQTLLPGHRYGLSAQCPFPIPGLPALGNLTQATLLLGLPDTYAVSYSPAADGKSFAIVFDYTGPQIVLPPIQAGGGTACTTQLMDMCPTPAAPIGGVAGGGGFTGQTVNVAWGGSTTAKATAATDLVINAPGPIVSVDTGGTGVSSVSGSSATVALNGSPGTVTVYGAPTSKYAKGPSATVTVS